MRRRGSIAALAGLMMVMSACSNAATDQQDASGPVKIGLSTPLSGAAASLGESERNGAQLAVEQVNGGGGLIDGRELSLKVQDNACNPTDGAASVSKLITDQKVSGLIGALCSGVTLAAMPIVARNKVPMVVATSTSPDITKASGKGGNKFTFRINPSDADLAVALASHLSTSGSAKKIAILAEDSTYGRTGAEALKQSLLAEGLQVTVTDFTPQGTADFSTLISKYRNNGSEAVALYITGADHLSFLRQAEAADLRLPVTGRVELEGQNLEVLQDEKFAGSSSVYPYSSLIDTDQNRKFVQLYEEKYGASPTYEAFEGYNAVLVFADAIRRAESADPEAIQKALAETSMPSLTGGTIKFDEHHQAHDKAFILELKDGKLAIVAGVNT